MQTDNLTERSRMVTAFIRGIVEKRDDLEKNRELLEQMVNTVNALILPRAWIGLDASGSLHVTYVRSENPARPELANARPTEMRYAADYIWCYTPWDNKVRCVKARGNRWNLDDTFECNAPVSVVP